MHARERNSSVAAKMWHDDATRATASAPALDRAAGFRPPSRRSMLIYDVERASAPIENTAATIALPIAAADTEMAPMRSGNHWLLAVANSVKRRPGTDSATEPAIAPDDFKRAPASSTTAPTTERTAPAVPAFDMAVR